VNLYFSIPILKRFIRWTINHADRLVTVSEAMKAELIRRGYSASKIDVVYNGVDESLFYPLDLAESRKRLHLPQIKKILLFVGSLTITSKGIDLLLDAVQEITESNLMVYLIGTGEEKPQIEALIHQKQLSDKIILHEPIPHAKLNDWFNAADLLVLPSRREGVPNVILEAMATGTPVVASNVWGIPEIVIPEISGLLHQPGSECDLREKITQALNHTWDKKIISQSSRRYSWTTNSQQYFQISQDLVKPTR
ncbi:MAG: glycosyltransferase, partial [Candidatus Neomarinimicrobiota bacterium]